MVARNVNVLSGSPAAAPPGNIGADSAERRITFALTFAHLSAPHKMAKTAMAIGEGP